MNSPILNCRNYDVTLTTSFEVEFGISGHTFELAEYFLFLKNANVSVCIALTNGLTLEDFTIAINEKYTLTNTEQQWFSDNVYFNPFPKLLLANTVIIVDGSFDIGNSTIAANRKLLFRCSTRRVNEIAGADCTVLQDNDLYESLPNSVHYKKKMYFDYFRKIDTVKTNTAMFYLTKICRNLSEDRVQQIITKYPAYSNYIALVNEKRNIHNVTEIVVPVKNLWEMFDDYIYTEPSNFSDCSPRFAVECKHYNKGVIFETPVIPKGLSIRMQDYNNGIVGFEKTDDIIRYI